MTRNSLKKTMRRAYLVLGVVLAVALVSKLFDHIPMLADTHYAKLAADVYEYLRDMALVFVTVVAAYLANVFQKRSKFVESLEEEWRGIVKTKSTLYTYCEKPYPSTEDYFAAFARISETIDNMRIVYRNAGETAGLIGLYPYAPLHDMRRALQTLDPRHKPNSTAGERKLVQDAILQSFYALRENFLEELDLGEPAHPLLIAAGRRMKKSGARQFALLAQERQRKRQNKSNASQPEVDSLLIRLYEAEKIAAGDPRPVDGLPVYNVQERGREA